MMGTAYAEQKARLSLRDLAADHEAREAVFGNRQDGVVPVVSLRVRATVRVVSQDWVELSLQLKTSPEANWMFLTNLDHPLMVARRFARPKERQGESMELYALSALKRALSAHGATVQLGGCELRPGDGVNEFRFWAHLGARLSVAVESQPDGTVRVLGLM